MAKVLKKEQDNEIKKYGFYTYENSYCFQEKIKNVVHDNRISNFVIKVLYHLRNDNEGKFILELTNKKGEITVFDISSDDFVNLSKFEAIIQPKYIFKGNKFHLNTIKEKIFENVKSAKEITTLGYQVKEKIFAFSNGILTPESKFLKTDNFGIVKHNDQEYYIPAFSSINTHCDYYINERKFLYKKGSLNFQEYGELVHQAYGFNGDVSLIYDIAALFRDIIFYHTTFFPYLFKFGVKGTAKSSHTQLSLSLFGEPQSSINLEGSSTEKGFSRKIAQIRNALILFEEYSNRISDKMIGTLKTAYDGIGYEKAQRTNDNKTTTTPVLSAIIITGNELPTVKSALFDRIILLQYEKGTEHNRHTEEEEKAYKELVLKAQNGLGQVVAEIFKYRELVQSKFVESYNNLKDYIKFTILKDYDIGTRAINNVAAILSPYLILCEILKFPFDDKQFTVDFANNLIRQNEILFKVSEISVFWESLRYGIRQSKLTNTIDYKFENKEGAELLCIRLENIYPVYVDFCNKNKSKDIDVNSLRQNLKSSKAFIQPDKDKHKRDTVSIRFKTGPSSAMIFNYKLINIDLKNISNEIQNENI